MAELKDLDVTLIDDPIIAMHPNPPIEKLKELAESIKQTGQKQEITVRKSGDRYQIVIGHNRVRAASMFGIPTLRARIEELSDRDSLLATATENIHRLEQDPLTEGQIFSDLKIKWGMSESQIAEKFGKTTSYIKSRLNLLELCSDVQLMVQNKELQLGIASELAKIEDPSQQVLVASDLRDRATNVERGKHIVNSFLEYRDVMPEAPSEDIIQKARAETLIVCHFCSQSKPITEIKMWNMCNTCYHGTIYMFEKERRASQKEEEKE